MKALSTIGSAPVYWILFAIVAAGLVVHQRRRAALFAVVTLLGGSVLNALVKALVDRARPVLPDPVAHAGGLSFPSGHAQSAMVVASILLLVHWGSLQGGGRVAALGLAAFMVLAIGFSRIALGVHYVSDVLAGYVLGAAWVAAMMAAFNSSRFYPPARTTS